MRCSMLFFLLAILWSGFLAICLAVGSLASVPCVLVIALMVGCGLDAHRDEEVDRARDHWSRADKSD